MVTAGPRIDPRLVDEIVRLDDGVVAIAEICRGVGACAERRGLTRPSYEAVRQLVHLARQLRASDTAPSRAWIWEQATRRSAYWAAFDQLLRAIDGRG